MDAVKRIEVLKGASSALYGSDAIAGVINIITDDPKSALNVSSNTRVVLTDEFQNQSTQTPMMENYPHT